MRSSELRRRMLAPSPACFTHATTLEARERSRNPEGRGGGGDTRCRVLIVDDNVDVGDSMALLARSWGHEVMVARNGFSALEIAERFQPQRALVDIGLPGMDGYELAHRLRATSQHPDFYLVAMSGYGQPADREKALAAGFDKHLVKPGDADELQGILAKGGR